MNCFFALRTDLLQSADTGGTWNYLGYHPDDPNGTPGSGGSPVPPVQFFGDNPILNSADFPIVGYYFFEYTGATNPQGQCVTPQTTYFETMPNPAGNDAAASYCTSDFQTIDLHTLIGAQTGGTWILTSGNPSGFNAAAGTLNLAANPIPAFFSFQYILSYTPPIGQNILACSDCGGSTDLDIEIVTPPTAGETWLVCVEIDQGVNLNTLHLDNSSIPPSLGGTWTFFGRKTCGTNGPYTSATIGVNNNYFTVSPFTPIPTPFDLVFVQNGCYDFRYLVGQSPCADDVLVTIEVQENCCTLPCEGNFTNCLYPMDIGTSISSPTIQKMFITSFIADGVQYIDPTVPPFVQPVQVGQPGAPNIVSVGGTQHVSDLITALNSIGVPYFDFLLPNVGEPTRSIRIKHPACQSFEIIIVDDNGGNPINLYKYDQTGAYAWNGSQWVAWLGFFFYTPDTFGSCINTNEC